VLENASSPRGADGAHAAGAGCRPRAARHSAAGDTRCAGQARASGNPMPLRAPAVVLIADARHRLFGGQSHRQTQTNDLWYFDVREESWTPVNLPGASQRASPWHRKSPSDLCTVCSQLRTPPCVLASAPSTPVRAHAGSRVPRGADSLRGASRGGNEHGAVDLWRADRHHRCRMCVLTLLTSCCSAVHDACAWALAADTLNHRALGDLWRYDFEPQVASHCDAAVRVSCP
jgi:hypothetical protein